MTSSLASQPFNVDGHATLRCSRAFVRNDSMMYLLASRSMPETTRKSALSLFPNFLWMHEVSSRYEEGLTGRIQEIRECERCKIGLAPAELEFDWGNEIHVRAVIKCIKQAGDIIRRVMQPQRRASLNLFHLSSIAYACTVS